MRYLKPIASCWSPTALKKPDRSKQCHCLQFAQTKSDQQTYAHFLQQDIKAKELKNMAKLVRFKSNLNRKVK